LQHVSAVARADDAYPEGLGSPVTGAGDGFGSQARPDPPNTGLLFDYLDVAKSRPDYSESRDN
jgi:hypothetical protein